MVHARVLDPVLLACRPERLVQSEEQDQHVVLLRPKFQRGLLARFLQPRLSRPFYRVHLDEVGSFIWGCCDGQTTVAQIGEKLAAKFGGRVAPAEHRLSLFLTQMQRSGLVRLARPGGG
jgi:hypothetical protein